VIVREEGGGEEGARRRRRRRRRRRWRLRELRSSADTERQASTPRYVAGPTCASLPQPQAEILVSDGLVGGSSRDDGRSTANYACTMSPRNSISSGAAEMYRPWLRACCKFRKVLRGPCALSFSLLSLSLSLSLSL